MASHIVELFGYAPADSSDAAKRAREEKRCPFLGCLCLKTLSGGVLSGVCTLAQVRGGNVVCCPHRLYAAEYACLRDVASIAFGPNCLLHPGQETAALQPSLGQVRVAVFGKRWGKELRLPNRGRSGGYFVDWVLARLDDAGRLVEFVAVEVQSIDTTGNYQAERDAYLNGQPTPDPSAAGFNWENVNKRILPQLIYKGHVLRRERLCRKGLFFICPTPVYMRIRERLGGNLLQYEMQSGALTLLWYNIGQPVPEGAIRTLENEGQFTTTVDQVALAFTSPSNLPDANVYEEAIKAELGGIA